MTDTKMKGRPIFVREVCSHAGRWLVNSCWKSRRNVESSIQYLARTIEMGAISSRGQMPLRTRGGDRIVASRTGSQLTVSATFPLYFPQDREPKSFSFQQRYGKGIFLLTTSCYDLVAVG